MVLTLTYHFEKITQNNIKYWLEYFQTQQNIIKNIQPSNKKFLKLTHMGVLSCLSQINIFTKLNNDESLYILYISEQKIYKSGIELLTKMNYLQPYKDKQIIMYITLLINNFSEICVGIGIQQSIEYFLSMQLYPENKIHNLSVKMWKYMGKFACEINKNCKYIISSPVSIMRWILLKNIDNKYIWLGDEKSIEKFLKQYKNWKNMIVDPNFNYILTYNIDTIQPFQIEDVELVNKIIKDKKNLYTDENLQKMHHLSITNELYQNLIIFVDANYLKDQFNKV